ncbi:PREDICTED: uncharacterized protein LOC106818060 isoform X2 [Priapulus caudatus]|uniref:Uncharacterized protein LOC106818060 isoform X2 n=1 Tax=Priapulus caudatus TaxID=37621 RepID=A0ABM1F1E6_PRICU|nr:PREDICTED: uncharacterized protein LOC106818060 isoform X2 [Priapulus caudatus]
MEVLASINEVDLKEMGVVAFGDRRRITLAVKSLQSSQDATAPSTSSGLNSDPTVTYLTLLDSENYMFEKDKSLDSDDTSSIVIAPNQSPVTVRTSSPIPKQSQRSSRGSSRGSTSSVGTVIEFDVRDVLVASADHSDIPERLDNAAEANEPVSEGDRKAVVRQVVRQLVQKCGHLYPSSEQKEALAAAVVKAFPALAAKVPGDAIGLEHVECMKYTVSTRENISKIRNLFKETHEYRRLYIADTSPTVTQILDQYPRIRDMPDLINLEYDMLYPGTGDEFIRNWHPNFTHKVLMVAKAQNSAQLNLMLSGHKNGDDDLCALLTMAFLMPFNSFRKKSSKGYCALNKTDALSFLIQNWPVGTDITTITATKDCRYSQPHLISIGPAHSPQQYFIVLDSATIPGGTSIVEAFDRLFKSFFVFNVHFPPALANYYSAISLIYKRTKFSDLGPAACQIWSQISKQ